MLSVALATDMLSLDLAGYRSGSTNEVLNARLKSRGLRRPGAL